VRAPTASAAHGAASATPARVVVVGPGGPAADLAAALSERGLAATAIPVGRRRRSAIVAVGRLARALRGSPAILVTISERGWLTPAARVLGRRGQRWIAHVAAPLTLRQDRWGRILDPRTRALRRADLVTAAPDAADGLHRTAGVAVGRVAADAAQLADVVEAVAARPVPTGMKILLLGTLNTPHVEHLATAMRDRGHDVVVAGEITPAYPPSVLPAEGIRVRPLEIPAMVWLRRLWREERPDVVHANWMTSYAFLAALLRLRPLVAMAWGSDVYGATPAQERKARFAARRADVAMSDSEDLVQRLVELGADAERTFLLNWGVDLATFAPPPDRRAVRRGLGLADGPVVLSPRALNPLYNPAVIVDAFEAATRDLPDAQLLLKHIGTGPPDLGRPLPEGVRVVGHVPYEQLPEYYRAADICVSIPNSDSSPRSVWEAMACGCACVISDLPWAHELIEDGTHALIVPPEPDAVAHALRRLLTEPGLAERIGAQARLLVERHRDQLTEMDRLAALYEGLAAAGRTR
jgi:glycosyltransferase involved in cell wall biosynthesis